MTLVDVDPADGQWRGDTGSGYGNRPAEREAGTSAMVVLYSEAVERGIRLKVGDRVTLRSLPGTWMIDGMTNIRIMLRGPAGASAQVMLSDLRAEIATVLR